MKFSAAFLALSLSSVSGAQIRSDSQIGHNLLSKARQLENNNNQYYSWVKDYAIKFDGCAAVPQFEREEGIRTNLLAKFKLCPADKCGRCPNAGEYLVDMRDFVEAYQEAKEQAQQATCEQAEYNCEYKCQNGQYQYDGAYGDDANNGDQNEYCVYQCLVDQGLGFCAQDADQDNEINMNELAECRPINEGNNNNNNNGNYNSEIYYVGAYCNSKGVFAGVFTDSACTKKAPSGTYEKYNYGYSLPSEPMIEYDCISCKQSNNNNNNNNNNNGNYDNISEFCEAIYEGAAKCEKKVKGINWQDNSACELIHTTIPKLSSSFRSGPAASKVFAWIFGVMIVVMGWYIYRLHMILRRPGNINTDGLVA